MLLMKLKWFPESLRNPECLRPGLVNQMNSLVDDDAADDDARTNLIQLIQLTAKIYLNCFYSILFVVLLDVLHQASKLFTVGLFVYTTNVSYKLFHLETLQ